VTRLKAVPFGISRIIHRVFIDDRKIDLATPMALVLAVKD